MRDVGVDEHGSEKLIILTIIKDIKVNLAILQNHVVVCVQKISALHRSVNVKGNVQRDENVGGLKLLAVVHGFFI